MAQLLWVGLIRLSAPDWPTELHVSGFFGVAKRNAETPLHQGIANAEGRSRICVYAARTGLNLPVLVRTRNLGFE